LAEFGFGGIVQLDQFISLVG